MSETDLFIVVGSLLMGGYTFLKLLSIARAAALFHAQQGLTARRFDRLPEHPPGLPEVSGE